MVTIEKVIIGHHQQNTGWWWWWPMRKKVIGEIFGHYHQHRHSWYPTYCNIKEGYLYTRGKLNLNICTKGCYFQFQCSVTEFQSRYSKYWPKPCFTLQELFSCPSEVKWAKTGDFYKSPLCQIVHSRCLARNFFNSMSWHVRCFEEDDPLCFILMHLFRVLHSRLDVNLPHAQAWMSHIHIHDSV